MAVVAGTALVKILPDLTSFAATLQGGIGAPLRNIGSSFTQAGRSLTLGLTLPIVGLGVAAVKSAMDWETSFAGVRKTLDATPEQLDKIERGLRDMTKEIPVSGDALAEIAEAAGAMGIKTEDILKFTRAVADMSATTNLTTDEAATAFGKLSNVLNLTGDDYERLGSTIVDLGNKGASTESEIVDMALRLAGTGATIGLAADEILGLAAAIADVGIRSEAGGTAMSRVLQDMSTQVATAGPKLVGFAKVAGMSADEFASAFRDKPGEAVQMFLEGLRTMRGEGGNLIGTLAELGITEARQIDTLARLAGAQKAVADSLGIAENAWREGTAMAKEAEERYKTFESQLFIFKGTAKDALISLGTALLPVMQSLLVGLKPVIEFVARMIEAFGRLPSGVQMGIVAFAAVIAAIGPLLMIIGAIASGIGAIIPIIGALGTAFGAIVAVITSPITLIIAAVALLGYVIYRNWDTIKSATVAVWNFIKTFLLGLWSMLKTAVTTVFNVYKTIVLGVWNAVKATTSAVWNGIRAVLTAVWNGIKTAITTYFNAYKAIITAVWNGIRAVTSAVWNGIRAVLSAVWSAIRGVVSGGINAIKSALSGGWNAIKSAAKGAWDFVVGIFQGAWRTISGIVSNITGALSKLAFWRSSPSLLEINAKTALGNVMGMFDDFQKELATNVLNRPINMNPAGISVGPTAGIPQMSLDAGGSSGTVAELRALRAEVRDLRNAFNVRLEANGRELAHTVNEENAFSSRGTS